MSRTQVLPIIVASGVALGVALGVFGPASALAAPRVGVVVLSHGGMTDEAADEISYDLAGVIASQIEGEAIAGTTVRDALTAPIEAGCETTPECGRKLGESLKTDEVLFLHMRKVGKGKKANLNDVAVDAVRVPRDATRESSTNKVFLTGPKARRGLSISKFVTELYPAGSVVAYIEPPVKMASQKTPQNADAGSKRLNLNARPPTDDEVAPREAEDRAKKDEEDKPAGPPVWKKGWFWGVMGGAAAVVAGVVVTVVILNQPGPSAPSVQLPGL